MSRVALDITSKELAEHGLRMASDDIDGIDDEPIGDVIDDIGEWLWPRLMEPMIERGYGFAPRMRLVPTGALYLVPVQAAWKKDLSAPDGKTLYG